MKAKLTLILSVLGLMLMTIVTAQIATAKEPAEPKIWLAVSPANPMLGEKVTLQVKVEGVSGDYQLSWNSDPTEMPELYNWNQEGAYPFIKTTEMCVTYKLAGAKWFSVSLQNGNKSTSRTMSFDVVEGRITLISPNGGEVWKVGQTYEIKWKTEGWVSLVQICLFDTRYPSETGSNGMQMLAFAAFDTGSFFYTVPPPNPNGISGGNLGGKNYYVSVAGWSPSTPGVSSKPFTITK